MTTARLKRPLGSAESNNPEGRKLFIATPCYGGQMMGTYVVSMENLCMSLMMSGIRFMRERIGNESLITRARNRLVAKFLKSDCTDLLFVDADVGFTPRDVQALTVGDFDVTVGAYPMKTYSWETIHAAALDGCPADKLALAGAMFPANATIENMVERRVELLHKGGFTYLEVMDGATGFMLIRRHVIERFIAHYKADIEYLADYDDMKGETHHMVFQAARDPAPPAGQLGRYLSEDYWFCRQWQRMGGKIHLCLDCKLTHTGTHRFVGDVATLFAPQEAPLEMVEPEPSEGGPPEAPRAA